MKSEEILTLDDLLKKLGEDQNNPRRDKSYYRSRYNKSLKEATTQLITEEGLEDLHNRPGQKGKGKYSLRNAIKRHSNTPRPASQAIRWLYREVFPNPKVYRYTRRILYQGGLFMFEYQNPKNKDNIKVLPWFDRYPLVLSLGPVTTNEGIRNLGFNLHLLPPGVRVIVLCRIFELYQRIYRYNIFMKKDAPVNVKYQSIIGYLRSYGVGFCVRMYIPSRISQIVRVPLKEWHEAIFVPSRGYSRIRAKALIKEWTLYCRKNNVRGVSATVKWRGVL